MNYHYIDYMIKERQREELDACNRRRLLKSSGHIKPSLIHKIGKGLLNTVRRLKEKQTLRHRRQYPCFSMADNVAQPNGDSQ